MGRTSDAIFNTVRIHGPRPLTVRNLVEQGIIASPELASIVGATFDRVATLAPAIVVSHRHVGTVVADHRYRQGVAKSLVHVMRAGKHEIWQKAP